MNPRRKKVVAEGYALLGLAASGCGSNEEVFAYWIGVNNDGIYGKVYAIGT